MSDSNPCRRLAPTATLQIGLERVLFKNQGPGKDMMQLGATAACEVPNGDIIVGGGDGSIVVTRPTNEHMPSNPKMLKRMPKLAAAKLEGAVTSIALEGIAGKACTFYVGTAACNIYKVTYEPGTGK